MKYSLLIHQEAAPTPRSPETLSEDERQAIYSEVSRVPAARLGGAIEVCPVVER